MSWWSSIIGSRMRAGPSHLHHARRGQGYRAARRVVVAGRRDALHMRRRVKPTPRYYLADPRISLRQRDRSSRRRSVSVLRLLRRWDRRSSGEGSANPERVILLLGRRMQRSARAYRVAVQKPPIDELRSGARHRAGVHPPDQGGTVAVPSALLTHLLRACPSRQTVQEHGVLITDLAALGDALSPAQPPFAFRRWTHRRLVQRGRWREFGHASQCDGRRP